MLKDTMKYSHLYNRGKKGKGKMTMCMHLLFYRLKNTQDQGNKNHRDDRKTLQYIFYIFILFISES